LEQHTVKVEITYLVCRDFMQIVGPGITFGSACVLLVHRQKELMRGLYKIIKIAAVDMPCEDSQALWGILRNQFLLLFRQSPRLVFDPIIEMNNSVMILCCVPALLAVTIFPLLTCLKKVFT
jgi:hypothetical protein